MSQEKQISQFLNALLVDDLANADNHLKSIMETKLLTRIREIDSQLDEGFFDRLGAKAAGFKAGVKTNLQNVKTGVKGAATATGQALTGNLGKAGMTLTKTQGAINKNDPATAKNQAAIDSIKASITTDIKALFPNASQAEVDAVLAAVDAIGPRLKSSISAKKSTVNPGIAAPGNPILPSAATP